MDGRGLIRNEKNTQTMHFSHFDTKSETHLGQNSTLILNAMGSSGFPFPQESRTCLFFIFRYLTRME